MRIYSNTLLSWPQVLYAFQAACLYPGRWMNYYYYRINDIAPLSLTTYSPIELLQENCQYYCYYNYHRDKQAEAFDNSFKMISILNNKPQFGRKSWAYIPKVAEPNDIIVIRDDITFDIPSGRISSLFTKPTLA